MASAKFTIDVEIGPVFQAAKKVLEFARDMADAVPDYVPEREDLLIRASALLDAMCDWSMERRQ